MQGDVVVLVDSGGPAPESIYWTDHITEYESTWGKGTLDERLCSLRSMGRLWKTVRSLLAAKLIITLHNNPSTRRILLMALMGVIRTPVAVLELNLKFNEMSRLERYLTPLLFSKAFVVTVLSPSDRDALLALPGWRHTPVCVLNQWAQIGTFEEVMSDRVKAILEKVGPQYAIAPGRSSRNFDELFRAMAVVPEARLVIVGRLELPIPEEVRSRVLAVEELDFHEYVYLLRRARLCLIPLLPVQHTCGIRVWFQSNAMGIPVIVTLTEPTGYYSKCGALALFYRSGDVRALGDHLERLWKDDAVRDSLATRSKVALEAGFGAAAYHSKVVELAGAVFRSKLGKRLSIEEWQSALSGASKERLESPTLETPITACGAACDYPGSSGERVAL